VCEFQRGLEVARADAARVALLVHGSNVNGSLEAGVGNAANLHLAAAVGGVVLPAVITVTTLAGREQTRVGGVFYTGDVVTEPFAYRNGCLTIPSGPGLGVDLDAVKIERCRVA
jgi:muconate cycloisomerase